MSTTQKQLMIGLVIAAAVLIAGYGAASPHNVKLVVLFAGMIILAVASVVPRLVVYGWILTSGLLMPAWHNAVSSRLSVHAATAVILLVFLFSRWAVEQRAPKLKWWEFGWPIFAVVCTFSAMRDSSYIPMNPVFIFRNLFMPFAFYLFAMEYFRTRETTRLMALVIVVVTVIMGFIGYYEYTTGNHLWYRGIKDVVVNSAYGPYFSPGRYGLMQVIGFFMILYLFWLLKRSRAHTLFWRAMLVGLLLFVGYSVLLCSERGVIISFGIALVYNIFLMRNRSLAIALTVIMVIGIGYNLERLVSETFIEQKMTLTDISVKRRLAQYISAVRIFVDKPVFGIGYHYFDNPNRVDKYTAYFGGISSRGKLIHNSPLDIVSTSGLVALVPYMIFLVGLFVTLLRAARRNKGDPMGYFALMALSIFITQQIQNQTAIEVYSEVLNTMTFLVYGAVVGYVRYRDETELVEDAAEMPAESCDIAGCDSSSNCG